MFLIRNPKSLVIRQHRSYKTLISNGLQVNHISRSIGSSFRHNHFKVMLMASNRDRRLQVETVDRSKKHFRVEVDPKLCKGCYFCIRYCPRGVFGKSETIGEMGYVVAKVLDPGKCTGCRLCLLYCPDFAVSIEEEGEKK